jgi:hypothetical protein
MLNKPSKLACLTYLSLLESIFIHYNIFWLSLAFDIGFFFTNFSTCFFTCVLPFCFIMGFVPNLECWRIMLETCLFSKSYWRNSPPLLTCCYNSFSSTGLDTITSCGCSLTKGCYNSSSSTCLDEGTNCGCSSTTSWGLISISSSEYEIKIKCGVDSTIKVVFHLKKFNTTSNSSSKSLFLCSYSNNLGLFYCRCAWSKRFYINRSN